MPGRQVVTVSAWFEVATPLFCAGPVPDDVRIRPASLRGVLRWWWRATAWGTLTAAGSLHRLGELAEDEAQVFGSANQRGRLTLRVIPPDLPKVKAGQLVRVAGGRQADVAGPGARYLGYGLFQGSPAEAERVFLQPASHRPLRVDVVCDGLEEGQLQGIHRALEALGLLGGLGARNRRGWGSLALLGIEQAMGWPGTGAARQAAPPGPPSFDGLCQQISTLLHRVAPGPDPYPPITALGPGTRVVAVPWDGPPLRALDAVGRELVQYRSWGRNGRVLGQTPAERNFRDDHDLMSGLASSSGYPRRAAFGLPHNYRRGGVRPAGNQKNQPGDRRASPLLLHAHPLKDGQSAVVCTFLPAQFLPGSEPKVQVTTSRGRHTASLRPLEEHFQPVAAFLDRLAANMNGREIQRLSPHPTAPSEQGDQ
jgi:CRISPR-associated protein Cmr1